MEIIEFKDRIYPAFQSKGFASKFAFPFAHEVCVGLGLDIGCNRLEWCLPGAYPVDPVINEFDAYNLPEDQWDFIFSSHCLEHLPHWVNALDYWTSKIKSTGVIFLYLPNMDAQEYWKPFYNRKHTHYLTPKLLNEYFLATEDKWSKVFITEGFDLNCSFYAVAEKI